MTSYPIDDIFPELKEAVRNKPSVILHAPPGAGKTTRVPLALLEVIPRSRGRIVMLEPRRIAAVSAARWMAATLDEQPGETIGYAIRFDAKISEKTRVEVVTEGILTRRIQSDPGLDNTAMVIFDEFHERSIHADLALALCLDIRRELRPDLKILVMSATLDYGPLVAMLGASPVITSSGRAFPVAERYLTEKAGSLTERITWAVRTALKETEGDILVFLPGSGEIRACMKELRENPDILENRILVHALYGDLAFEEQERAIIPSRDHRKIVLATNIAESSLTIQGVRAVVDSGLTRMLRYDPATGMNRLVTVTLSQASAEQRKGRAGRLGPGVCYRLYDPQELHSMLPFAKPEILVSDLAPLALRTCSLGCERHADAFLARHAARGFMGYRAAVAERPWSSRFFGFDNARRPCDGAASPSSQAFPSHDEGAGTGLCSPGSGPSRHSYGAGPISAADIVRQIRRTGCFGKGRSIMEMEIGRGTAGRC